MGWWLPSVEASDAFLAGDVSCCGEEVGLLGGVVGLVELLGLELDDDLDHVDGLDHAGREHA
jgi:hypothetical protein